MRLLLVKLSSLGDVAHTMYALSDAMTAIPGIEIDWLVEEAFVDLAGLHPAVSEVIPVRLRAIRKGNGRLSGMIGHGRELKARLRQRRYDVVIDAQGLLKSAMLARLAGRPVAGPDSASARETAASIFYRHRINSPLQQHAATRTRKLFADALGYRIASLQIRAGLPVERLRAEGEARLRAMGLSGPRLFAVHGSAWPTKTWSEDRWKAVIAYAVENGFNVVLPAGNDAERIVAERIADRQSHALVLPKMDLAELLPLIAACDAVAGVDSGLTHIAEALGLPGAMLMGPTDPIRTGPLGNGVATVMSSHDNAPCYRREAPESPTGRCCMEDVAIEAVTDALAPLLAAQSPRQASAR
ncbi:MAG: lipopolysaccharide heptosyltransferase I [Pseudomonadota bacterium]